MTLADISVGYPLFGIGKSGQGSMFGPRSATYSQRLLSRPAFLRAAAVP
jgi:hypothetical protein